MRTVVGLARIYKGASDLGAGSKAVITLYFIDLGTLENVKKETKSGIQMVPISSRGCGVKCGMTY